MRRRRALRLLATASVPLAGCTTTDSAGTTTSTTPGDTVHEIGDTVSIDGMGTVAVTEVSVQASAYKGWPHLFLRRPSNGQYVVLETSGIDAREGIPFRVRIDERIESSGSFVVALDGTSHAYRLPTTSAETGVAVLERGPEPAWELPARALERLAAAPDFHLLEAVVRQEDGHPVLELTVENRGDRDGTFRCIVDIREGSDLESPVSFSVPVGETVTETVRNGNVEQWAIEGTKSLDVPASTRYFSHTIESD